MHSESRDCPPTYSNGKPDQDGSEREQTHGYGQGGYGGQGRRGGRLARESRRHPSRAVGRPAPPFDCEHYEVDSSEDGYHGRSYEEPKPPRDSGENGYYERDQEGQGLHVTDFRQSASSVISN